MSAATSTVIPVKNIINQHQLVSESAVLHASQPPHTLLRRRKAPTRERGSSNRFRCGGLPTCCATLCIGTKTTFEIDRGQIRQPQAAKDVQRSPAAVGTGGSLAGPRLLLCRACLLRCVAQRCQKCHLNTLHVPVHRALLIIVNCCFPAQTAWREKVVFSPTRTDSAQLEENICSESQLRCR